MAVLRRKKQKKPREFRCAIKTVKPARKQKVFRVSKQEYIMMRAKGWNFPKIKQKRITIY